MGVNIAAQFKKDERGMNGLLPIVGELLDEPREKRFLVAEYEVVRVTEDLEDGGIKTPTIKLLHIEPMVAADAEKSAAGLIQAAYLARQGVGAVSGGQPDLFADADDDITDDDVPPVLLDDAAAADIIAATNEDARKPGSRAARKHLFSEGAK